LPKLILRNISEILIFQILQNSRNNKKYVKILRSLTMKAEK
jgi:hypothetical protein